MRAGPSSRIEVPLAPMESIVGQTVSHYAFLEKLGAGGMGEIYKARDSRLNRIVAVKVLAPGRTRDPERRRRFIQEAQSASGAESPQYHHHSRHPVGRRHAIHGDGTRLRQDLARHDRGGPAPGGASAADFDADGERADGRARRRNYPPRSQTGQRDGHRFRPGEDPGLRIGEIDGSHGTRAVTGGRRPARPPTRSR